MLVGAEMWRFVARLVVVVVVLVGAVSSTGPVPAEAAGFTCTAGGPTYTVRPGDGWFVIADRVDVGAGELLAVNGAGTSDLLVPGDRLCLPPGADLAAACDQSYEVRRGDGWYAIAGRSGSSVSALLAANAAQLSASLHPGQIVCLPAGASRTSGASPASTGSYTVARGDSWYGIAARAGVTARSLLAVNGASVDHVIVPGETLRLPAGARQPALTGVTSQRPVDLQALPAQGPCAYADTWRDARGGGRRHAGTDIFTGSRDYVYAVVDGRLTDRDWDQPGQISGNAWTLTAADGTYYFYAHLADFNPALRVGSTVRAGEILGWIGSTGNASAPHLHFEIHPGGGAVVNPYPVLRAEGGCNSGTPYRQPGGWVPD